MLFISYHISYSIIYIFKKEFKLRFQSVQEDYLDECCIQENMDMTDH